jgi:PAS domain S-box-containing protein
VRRLFGVGASLSSPPRVVESRDVVDLPAVAGFGRLVDLALDLFAIADSQGRFTQLNPSWERVLGWTREELMEIPFIEFVHPDDRAGTVAVLDRTSEAGYELVQFENRYRCCDGSYRWLSWRASTDGTQWYAVARDVTERHQQVLEREQVFERMRALVIRRTRDLRSATGALEVAETEIVRRLSMAVEWRDDDTGRHIDRVSRFSSVLAQRAGLGADLWEPIRFASPLHDAGKVAIPDAVLLKPGKLTAPEREVMETHAELGYELLSGSASPILELAATIARTHHERYDGNGYPRGLVGEAIPIEGRIVAIVDVFDALTSDRVYRPAFPVERALQMMTDVRGAHFDPELFDAFLACASELKDERST